MKVYSDRALAFDHPAKAYSRSGSRLWHEGEESAETPSG